MSRCAIRCFLIHAYGNGFSAVSKPMVTAQSVPDKNSFHPAITPKFNRWFFGSAPMAFLDVKKGIGKRLTNLRNSSDDERSSAPGPKIATGCLLFLILRIKPSAAREELSFCWRIFGATKRHGASSSNTSCGITRHRGPRGRDWISDHARANAAGISLARRTSSAPLDTGSNIFSNSTYIWVLLERY